MDKISSLGLPLDQVLLYTELIPCDKCFEIITKFADENEETDIVVIYAAEIWDCESSTGVDTGMFRNIPRNLYFYDMRRNALFP